MTQLPANARIIDLPVGTAPVGTEPIETVQGGISVQLTQAQIALSIAPALSVRGNPTNASAAVQDVVGTANQVLRVNAAGTSWSWGQVNLASASAVTGVLVVVNGGTGFGTYTLGDTLYSDAINSLAKLAGNITTTRKFKRQTGNGAVSAAPVWDTILAADIPASALTKIDDTNVTLTLGGSPNTALLAAASITAGWTGTLAAARLNANVVQSVVNDTNVTGSIATQALTLGWTGTLAASRLNANVVQSVVNDTNITGSIATQALTLGWTGTLAVTRGGIGVGTLTNHGVLLGQGTSVIVATSVMTDGQLLVGQSAADPLPKTLSSDATLAASGALTIANNAVSYAKMQDISATSRFLGRITAGAGDTEELTGTQATTLLDVFTSGLKGLAPASGGGTTNFLRADGTWAGAAFTAATQAEQEAASSTTVGVSPGRQQFHPSASKAWARWNAAVSVAANYNAPTVTDNGAGDWTVNFTTAFSSANYGISGAPGQVGTSTTTGLTIGANPAAGSCRMFIVAGNINQDPAIDVISASFFGDQ